MSRKYPTHIFKATMKGYDKWIVHFNFKGIKNTQTLFDDYEKAVEYRDKVLSEYYNQKIERNLKEEKLEIEFPYNILRQLDITKDNTEPALFIVMCENLLTKIESILETALFTEREKEIVRKRYIENLTLEQVGAQYGITRERVRQIEVKALKKLKYHKDYFFATKDISDYEKQATNELNEKLKEDYERLTYETALVVVAEYERKAKTYAENIKIADLNLSVRSYNALKRGYITNVAELLKCGKENLKKLRNLGSKSYNEIINKIDELGFKFDETNL